MVPRRGQDQSLKGTYAVVGQGQERWGARFRRGSNVLAIERDGTHWRF